MVVWAFILFSGISAFCCYPDRKVDIIFVLRMVLYVMWFIFEFTFMCARFHWMLNSEDAKFETMSIKTENKKFIWKGPKFNVSSRTERVHAGCNFTVAHLEHAPKDACKVWWVEFNADIHFKGDDWYVNAAKFSVGFGLLIYAIIKMVVVVIVEQMAEHFALEDDDDDQHKMTAVHPMPPPRILSMSPSQRDVMTAETPIGLAPDGTDVGNGQGFVGKNLCLRAKKAIMKARISQGSIQLRTCKHKMAIKLTSAFVFIPIDCRTWWCFLLHSLYLRSSVLSCSPSLVSTCLLSAEPSQSQVTARMPRAYINGLSQVLVSRH
jgi:hypothetical protein